MNHKITYYITILLALTTTLFSSCKSSSSSVDLKDFKIKDTASIYRFTITTNNADSITLSRMNEKKVWMIENPNYKANMSNIQLIMETFYRIQVKQPVSKNAEKNVIKRLAVSNKRVDIYDKGNKLIKTWYIGSPTPDHLGTYMLLKQNGIKGSKPYIMFKPGVYGSLDVRFFTDWTQWRSPQIFHYPNPNDILQVSLNYNQFQHESFIINRNNNEIGLLDSKSNPINQFDTVQLKHYFTHFNNICYNKIMFVDPSFRDSVFSSEPYIDISLLNRKKETTNVQFWRIKNVESSTNWDKEYGYIRVNGSDELLRAQYFNWDIIFKPLSFFTNDIRR